MEAKINKVAQMIAASKKLVVFTGAGISTESGIPDFRGPDGLWTKVDPEDFTIDRFLASGETRTKVWYYLVEGGLMTNSQPNRAHLAIAELTGSALHYSHHPFMILSRKDAGQDPLVRNSGAQLRHILFLCSSGCQDWM